MSNSRSTSDRKANSRKALRLIAAMVALSLAAAFTSAAASAHAAEANYSAVSERPIGEVSFGHKDPEARSTLQVPAKSFDRIFYVANAKQYSRILVKLFHWKPLFEPSYSGSLGGRLLGSLTVCGFQKLVSIIGGPSKLKAVAVWKQIAKAYETSDIVKLRGALLIEDLARLEKVDPDLIDKVWDFVGVHSCTEFLTWFNYLIDVAGEILAGRGAHMILHVHQYEWAGIERQCLVDLRYGERLDNLSVSESFYMDGWGHEADCPRGVSNWDMPIKYAAFNRPFVGHD